MTILHQPSFDANPQPDTLGIENAGLAPGGTLTERDTARLVDRAERTGREVGPMPRDHAPASRSVSVSLDADLLAKVAAIKARETAE